MVDINHHLLVALGVGHRSLEKLCAISAERGFHTKLTGAGGGGCALTLVPEGMLWTYVTCGGLITNIWFYLYVLILDVVYRNRT